VTDGAPAVCVCGGGHLAHALVAVLGAAGFPVRVLTREPAGWGGPVEGRYGGVAVVGRPEAVAADPAAVVPGSGVVLLAVPASAHEAVLERIAPHVASGTWVGAFPGTGGFAWLAEDLLPAGTRVFGVQRSPYNCRVAERGRVVDILGVRPDQRVAARPGAAAIEAAALVERLLGIPSFALGSFLEVMLVPANAVFHPVRMASLFADPGRRLVRVPMFYEDWDDGASALFLACDAEIQALCRTLPLNLHGIRPIAEHYRLEAATSQALTARIRAIGALAGIPAPVRAEGDGFAPDLGSRFLTEDVPHGLVVIRAVADLAGVAMPTVDRVIRWAEGALGLRFLEGGRVAGPDAAALPLPRRFGIATTAALAAWARR
jgi:opine dehydrogenase